MVQSAGVKAGTGGLAVSRSKFSTQAWRSLQPLSTSSGQLHGFLSLVFGKGVIDRPSCRDVMLSIGWGAVLKCIGEVATSVTGAMFLQTFATFDMTAI
jgi:hypothetical protein